MTELRDLPPSSRMFAVYAAYGKAMMFAHALEQRLAALVFAGIVETTSSGSEREQRLQRLSKMTLGVLIKEFVALRTPSEELEEELDNMLYFRNKIAHEIAETVLAAAMDQEWEERVNAELSEWASMFRDTEALLQPYIDDWFLRNKINQQEAFLAMKRLYPGVQQDEA